MARHVVTLKPPHRPPGSRLCRALERGPSPASQCLDGRVLALVVCNAVDVLGHQAHKVLGMAGGVPGGCENQANSSFVPDRMSSRKWSHQTTSVGWLDFGDRTGGAIAEHAFYSSRSLLWFPGTDKARQ